MSAPLAHSWEKAPCWFYPGRSSLGLLISARFVKGWLILPVVSRGRKSLVAGSEGPDNPGQSPCQLVMAFGHIPFFEPPVFQTPQQQGAQGEALAAQLLSAPTYLVGVTAVYGTNLPPISSAAPGEGGATL